MTLSKEDFYKHQTPVTKRILLLYDELGTNVLTTTQIRKYIDLSHQTLLKKLAKLEQEESLRKQTFPGSRVIFWQRL